MFERMGTDVDRTILHCDCNSFYASVETLLDPTLADGPSAVCGDPESRHGIILAKNEKAKAFGVQTAETIWQARRKCPDLRLVAPHRAEYVKYSRKCVRHRRVLFGCHRLDAPVRHGRADRRRAAPPHA